MSDVELEYLRSIQDAANNEFKFRFLDKYNIANLKKGDVLKIQSDTYVNSISIIKILKLEYPDVEYRKVWYRENGIINFDYEYKSNFETLVGIFNDSKTVIQLDNFDFDTLFNKMVSSHRVYLEANKEILKSFNLL